MTYIMPSQKSFLYGLFVFSQFRNEGHENVGNKETTKQEYMEVNTKTVFLREIKHPHPFCEEEKYCKSKNIKFQYMYMGANIKMCKTREGDMIQTCVYRGIKTVRNMKINIVTACKNKYHFCEQILCIS